MNGHIREIREEDIFPFVGEYKKLADEKFEKIANEIGKMKLISVKNRIVRFAGTKTGDVLFLYAVRVSPVADRKFVIPIRVREGFAEDPSCVFSFKEGEKKAKEIPFSNFEREIKELRQMRGIKFNPFTGFLRWRREKKIAQEKSEQEEKKTVPVSLVREFKDLEELEYGEEGGKRIPFRVRVKRIAETIRMIAEALLEIERVRKEIEEKRRRALEKIRKEEKERLEPLQSVVDKYVRTIQEEVSIVRNRVYLALSLGRKFLFVFRSRKIIPSEIEIDQLYNIIDNLVEKTGEGSKFAAALKEAIENWRKEAADIDEKIRIIPEENIPRAWETERTLKGQAISDVAARLLDAINEIIYLFKQGLVLLGETELPALVPEEKEITPAFAPAFASKIEGSLDKRIVEMYNNGMIEYEDLLKYVMEK